MRSGQEAKKVMFPFSRLSGAYDTSGQITHRRTQKRKHAICGGNDRYAEVRRIELLYKPMPIPVAYL
jgi:hypothetical protein